MFKTGDCVDFQIATNPVRQGPAKGAGPGDIRVRASPLSAEPGVNQVVVYRHRIPEAEKRTANLMDFNSPIRKYHVDDVRTPAAATASVSMDSGRYVARLTIPLRELGLTAEKVAGESFTATATVRSICRGSTGPTRRPGSSSDVPGEVMPEPNWWGTIVFEP